MGVIANIQNERLQAPSVVPQRHYQIGILQAHVDSRERSLRILVSGVYLREQLDLSMRWPALATAQGKGEKSLFNQRFGHGYVLKGTSRGSSEDDPLALKLSQSLLVLQQ